MICLKKNLIETLKNYKTTAIKNSIDDQMLMLPYQSLWLWELNLEYIILFFLSKM